MKRKLLILIIIMTFVAPLFLGIYKVQAFDGEIAPENYITHQYQTIQILGKLQRTLQIM